MNVISSPGATANICPFMPTCSPLGAKRGQLCTLVPFGCLFTPPSHKLDIPFLKLKSSREQLTYFLLGADWKKCFSSCIWEEIGTLSNTVTMRKIMLTTVYTHTSNSKAAGDHLNKIPTCRAWGNRYFTHRIFR